MQTSHVEECPEIGPICDERDEPAQQHDQDIAMAEVRLLADVAFDDRWGASVLLPVRLTDTSIVFRDLAGAAVELEYENIHHRNETLLGFSDAWVLGAFRPVSELSLRAGTTLPLGRTEDDPFAAGERGEAHEHVQFGTGTFQPVLGAGLDVPVGPVKADAWGLAVLSLYENGKGYQPGHRLAAGAGASRIFGPVNARLGLEVQTETAERWAGSVPTSDGTRGRLDVLAAGSGAMRLGELDVGIALRVPLHTRVVGGQLQYPLVAEVSVARTFGF
jgi:hypothetical protein